MTWAEHTRDLLYGILVAGSLVAGLAFFKYWRKSGDRLFAMFAVSFWLLALNWAVLPFVPVAFESREIFYLIRLAAFSLIIWAIVDKNRRRD